MELVTLRFVESQKMKFRTSIDTSNKGRDLALTTDFRYVLGAVLTRRAGVRDLSGVFPGFDNDARKFPGLIRV